MLLTLASLGQTLTNFVVLIQGLGLVVLAGALLRGGFVLMWAESNVNKRAEVWSYFILAILGFAIVMTASDIASTFAGQIQ